jgi:hypothetical protein
MRSTGRGKERGRSDEEEIDVMSQTPANQSYLALSPIEPPVPTPPSPVPDPPDPAPEPDPEPEPV